MRSLKIYEAGKRNETLWQIIRDNVALSGCEPRRPPRADRLLPARRAALWRADRALRPRHRRGLHRTRSGTRPKLRARAVVEKIPDGDYEAESFLDNDGRTLDKPLRVKVKVRIRGSQMTVDFSEMNPQTPGPLNSGRGGGIAGARVAFKALTSPDLDVNEGCFRAARSGAARRHHALAPSRRRRSASGASRCRPSSTRSSRRSRPPCRIWCRPRTRATWAAARSSASATTARASC